MKNIHIILLFFFTTSFFAQDHDIQALLDACSKDVVPKDFEYFNLVDSSFVMELDKYSLNDIDDHEFLKEYADFDVVEFVKKAESAKKINWKQFKYSKTNLYSIDSIPKYSENSRINTIIRSKDNSEIKIDFVSYNQLRLFAGKNKNEDEIKRAIDSAWENHDKAIRIENKVYFKFSTPLFSENKKYAIIKIDNSGSGSYFVYKREANTWKSIYRFGRWIA